MISKKNLAKIIKKITKSYLFTLGIFSISTYTYAWEFNASGSSSATYKRTTFNSGTSGANDNDTNEYTSSAGGVTVSLTHSDGYANSAKFSYTADWNSDAGNFDEYVKVSGIKKVGGWTASSSTTQHMQKDVTGAGDHAPMTSANSASFTLTNGSITYKLGDTAHLSTAEKTVNGPMEGTVDAEARVDSFDGFSIGFELGSGTLTVAIDENDDQDMFGDRDLIVTCGSDNMGLGINFSGEVGIDLSLTYAIGSATANKTQCTGDNSSNTASMSTIGLGIAVPFGGMQLAFDLESTAWDSKARANETKESINGLEISFIMPVGKATAGINLSQQENQTISGGLYTAKTSIAGTEAWYNVPIGPVGLSIGYGLSGTKVGCSTCSVSNEITSTSSQLGAEMTMSF
tara:strand:+ start:7712 stop:8917 length:1206 start_codon:yes stop_codon:yes gene_type:complete